MSVLSRHTTIPTQRTAERVIDLDAPAPGRHTAPSAGAARRRRLLLVTCATVVVAGAIAGTTAYVVLSEESAPSTRVDVRVTNSETKRDAATAARGDGTAAAANTEALRDAAAAARHATR